MMTKNEKIKATLAATRGKRKSQDILVFKVKVDMSSLSKRQREELKMMFVEGKWFYNDQISRLKDGRFGKENVLRIKQVTHFDKDKNEILSDLEYLPAFMKQTLECRIKSSLKTMSTLRKRGFQKRGELKFIRELTALDLRQYEKTYSFRSRSKMKIAGVHGLVRVNGTSQFWDIPNLEFANAKLLDTAKGYYVAVTCFIPKGQKKTDMATLDKVVGVDFGCQTSLTTSDGEKINASFGEGERLKRLQRRLGRKEKSSNRRRKLINLIRKEHERIVAKREDLSNKIVHDLLRNRIVVIQDENLTGWSKSGHGKAVQHSVLGRVKAKLLKRKNVFVLDRFIPTTKLCPHCGHVNRELSLRDRIFVCPRCGQTEDRDVHAAKNMVWMYENLVGWDTAELTLVEFKTSMSRMFSSEAQVMER